MMMEFKEMLIRAKRGEKNAQEKLLEMYRPLLMRDSIIEGVFDEDLYQELGARITFETLCDKSDLS